jgi:hypothetical protein
LLDVAIGKTTSCVIPIRKIPKKWEKKDKPKKILERLCQRRSVHHFVVDVRWQTKIAADIGFGHEGQKEAAEA